MTDPAVSFFSRLALAWRVIIDVIFAGRVARLLTTPEPVPALTEPKREPEAAPTPPPAEPDAAVALQLLALLQREGRLVDFLQQDVTAFGDAEIGAAARVVHDGCRKALLAHAKIVPVRSEAEGSRVTLESGFDASRVKLTGNVQGRAPYRGVLKHRGWQVESMSLPRTVGAHDRNVLAPAEVEL